MKTFCFVLVFCFARCHAFCQTDDLQPNLLYSSSFVIDEIPRTITYYTPSQYGKQESYALLIFLQDDKSNTKGILKNYGDILQAKADSLGFVIMYPDAVAAHWNSKINSAVKDSVNDAGFISIMLDYFVQQYHCDANRIYLMGIGNGGNMCYRFNCENNSKPVAIATINASNNIDKLQECLIKKVTPSINTIKVTDIKSGIEKSFWFLFAGHKNQE